jgi:hypothetical protein
MQALKLKATVEGTNPTIVEAIINDPENHEILKKDLRNVCALIPVPLFEHLENLCKTLELSKREVVNLALIDFFEKADRIIEEINPFEAAHAFNKSEAV